MTMKRTIDDEKKSEKVMMMASESSMASYGSWTSPLTSKRIASSSIKLSNLQIYNGNIIWLELRPSDDGRSVIVMLNDEMKDGAKDITPKQFDSFSTVNDYGGGSYIILKNGLYLSCNESNGVLYLIDAANHSIVSATSKKLDGGSYSYSDFTQNPMHQNQIVCIREEHLFNDNLKDLPSNVTNCLVCINIKSRKQRVIAAGNAFYAAPRISPNGKYLAYITWNFPNMPWDKTYLYVATLIASTGSIYNSDIIAFNCSNIEPRWSLDGNDLFFISDKTGFWSIYKYNIASKQLESQKLLAPLSNMLSETQYNQYEFGEAMWYLRQCHYDFMDNKTIIATGIDSREGISKLFYVEITDNVSFKVKVNEIELNSDLISYISDVVVDRKNNNICILGGGPYSPLTIFSIQLNDDNQTVKHLNIIRSSANIIDKKYISKPKHTKYPTTNSEYAFAYIYEPKNDDFVGNKNEKPPLLVICHGGPTAATQAIYNEFILFYTSRGWTVADVNYRGSTGYGTKYRDLLYGKWGVDDVNDCIQIAKYLTSKNKVNPKSIAIRGASAGGYTTLCALTFDKDYTFSIGCCQSGVCDAKSLIQGTHKYEAQYLYNLLSNDDKILAERSPINYTKNIKNPIIFLHGDEDPICPPEQATSMYEALKANKIKTCLELFKGEEHHFVKSEDQIKAYDYEYRFYNQLLHFPLSKKDDQEMTKLIIEI